MGDVIAGKDYSLTPAEAFVLGGAFLVHDLGMAACAYSLKDGALEAMVEFKLAAADYRARGFEADAEKMARLLVLRNYHSREAEKIPQRGWLGIDGADYYLIENPSLRQFYGPVIGKIASSHGWSTQEVQDNLGTTVGPCPPLPQEWTVDRRKVALLLRVCDASQIDSRRAPGFLAALRRPAGYARQHWMFQKQLAIPVLEGDSLAYFAPGGFDSTEVDAWWLAFETLQMVDKELRLADSVLTENGQIRFEARRVKGVEDPLLLAKSVVTNGWKPVDVQVRISDVPNVVRKFGGLELYGSNFDVPIRELIQNGRDAAQAMLALDSSGLTRRRVCVSFGTDESGAYLEVSDSGIGMKESVLTGPLLDFGVSYWGGDGPIVDLPGLAARGFAPVGRYGIGFFSTFMLGDSVRVVSRHFTESPAETRVLEFRNGLSGRPVLLPACTADQQAHPGTSVRVRLSAEAGVRLPFQTQDELREYCAWLCPSLDVDLCVRFEGGPEVIAVTASDWVSMQGEELLRRIWWRNRDYRPYTLSEAAKLLRVIRDEEGRSVGRVGFAPFLTGINMWSSTGVVTVGGLRSCGVSLIAGILIGEPSRIARDEARPVVHLDVLADWASHQADLLQKVDPQPEYLIGVVNRLIQCGGDPKGLPVGISSAGQTTIRQVGEMAEKHDEVLLLTDVTKLVDGMKSEVFNWIPNLLFADSTLAHILQTEGGGHRWPTRGQPLGLIIKTCREVWKVTPAEIPVQARKPLQKRPVNLLMNGNEAAMEVYVLSRATLAGLCEWDPW